MKELTINNLENCFSAAKENGAKFVGVKISMKDFPVPEVIINEYPNFDKKLEYYKGAYNTKLARKATDAIKIVGFTYGNSYEEIQKDLI